MTATKTQPEQAEALDLTALSQPEIGAYAEAVLAKEAALDAIKAKQKERLKAIKDKDAGRIKELDAEIAAELAALEQWALLHPDAFGKKRSFVEGAARIGFRTASKEQTSHPLGSDDDLLERLLADDHLQARYVRWKIEPTIDRETMIADHRLLDAGLPADAPLPVQAAHKRAQDGMYLLRQLGVRLEKGETFYVEPATK